MNQMLIGTGLRDLPEYLIENYASGKCSETEKKLVEKLIHLPYNSSRYEAVKGKVIPPISPERIKRLMALAENLVKPQKVEVREYFELEMIEPEAGQIWSVKQYLKGAPNSGYLPIAKMAFVFLLTNPNPLPIYKSDSEETPLGLYIDDRFVEFLPVSIHTEFADQHDFILPPEKSGLGSGAIIQTEINGATLTSNLDRCFGKLSEEDAEKLLNLYFYTHKMGHESELLEQTATGSDNYSENSVIVEFKEIEFENAQVISEPVDDLMQWLENLKICVIYQSVYSRVRNLAAASNEIDVRGLTPDSSEEVFNDGQNLEIALNRYDQKGYYFKVNVAPEACNGNFSFTVQLEGEYSDKMEYPREPGEWFFPLHQDFKSGLYNLSVNSGSKVLFNHSLFLLLEDK